MTEPLEPIDICNALAQWADAAEVESPRAGTGGRAVYKSCLLNRLIYGRERGPSRTPCPVHKGHWSGIAWGWPGSYSVNVQTGVRRDEPTNPRLQEMVDAGCRCWSHKGSGDTTGWNPDEFCCAGVPSHPTDDEPRA